MSDGARNDGDTTATLHFPGGTAESVSCARDDREGREGGPAGDYAGTGGVGTGGSETDSPPTGCGARYR